MPQFKAPLANNFKMSVHKKVAIFNSKWLRPIYKSVMTVNQFEINLIDHDQAHI